ncbi:MAG: hypothetical protein AAFV88_09320 [Planctomycetota bacterium]
MRLNFSLAILAALLAVTVLPGNAFAEDTAEAVSVDVFKMGTMEVPEEFKRTQPKSRILEHEFKVGEDGQTARLTMMAAGGGVEPNIKRWKGQFSGGKPEDQKVEKIKAGPFEVHLIDVSGSFAESMGGGPFAPGKTVQRENYAMAGAILAAPTGRLYFVKMIGPQETVKANREKFVKMVKSVEQ